MEKVQSFEQAPQQLYLSLPPIILRLAVLRGLEQRLLKTVGVERELQEVAVIPLAHGLQRQDMGMAEAGQDSQLSSKPLLVSVLKALEDTLPLHPLHPFAAAAAASGSSVLAFAFIVEVVSLEQSMSSRGGALGEQGLHFCASACE